ncbi:MAG TPA: type I-E CRISPR-associated protein Cas5/CasD [Balneolaceae bacterium]|nr:type I-E CRISPR-associated protein Cas5/CasD [Balneolaceae bacterium]
MEILILRLQAPLMSFGAPIVDNYGKIQAYPALSMMTGLLGNALGFDHSDFTKLQGLQERLRYASRQDKAGQFIQDFQTVDISKPHMRAYKEGYEVKSRAWTTRGKLENRTRDDNKGENGPLLRYRDYRADAIHTIALTLQPKDESPTLDDLAMALKQPERPLFIGRKTCLPSSPLLADSIQAENLTEALRQTPLAQKADQRERYPAWWPVDRNQDQPKAEIKKPVTDQRDWANQIHVGERWIARGEIEIETQEVSS